METFFDKQRLLEGAIQLWRKSLVSFDGNNRQLYYRRKKVGDIDLNDDQLDQFALTRLLGGEKVRASALYPKIYSRIDANEVPQVASDDDTTIQGVDDEMGEVDSQGTTDAAQEWAQRLRRYEAVFRKTREDSDERNIDTAFIAEGFAVWQPRQSGTAVPNAPLLLHPVRIDSKSRGNSDFELEKVGETTLNEALCLYLETEFGLPREIFELEVDELRLDSPEIKTLIATIAEVVPAFRVKEEKIIGNFSFSQYPMVVDLQRIIDQGSNHPILSALAGIGSAVVEISEKGSEEELEDLAVKHPSLENLVFPADSSQHAAISAVMGGKNVVIQGPPGTGKSQTIANVIAECAANGKTVLFVAEKRAAIDAVVERLDERGLHGIVLDLHGEPDKKTIAKNLTEVLKTFRVPHEIPAGDQEKLVRAKTLLQKRWKWMHQPTSVLDFDGNALSIADLFRQVGLKGSAIDREGFKGGLNYLGHLDKITPVVREEIGDRIDLLYRCHFFESSRSNPFTSEVSRFIRTADEASELVKALSELRALTATKEFRTAPDIAQRLGTTTSPTFENVLAVLKAFLKASDAVAEWDIEKYDEVIALIPAYGPLGKYAKARDINIFSALFARKRERKTTPTFRRDAQSEVDETSTLKSLIAFKTGIASWRKLGGNLETLADTRIDASRYRDVLQQALPLIQKLDAYKTEWSFETAGFDDLTERIELLNQDLQYIRDMPLVYEALEMVKEYALLGVVDMLFEQQIPQSQARNYWEYLWYAGKLQQALLATGDSAFHSTTLNNAVSEFRYRDQEAFASAPGRIIRSITSSLGIPGEGQQLLRKESFKKSGHLPFRELVNRIPQEIMSIKPCFAMSPLNVSKILPSVEGLFDVVIFDEASQIRPEIAITSIYRGKQLVVAGDRHQLPPTSVGQAIVMPVASTEMEESASDTLMTSEMESILDAFAATLPVNSDHIKPLRLHYRSNDERLISWSNFHIYREAGEELASFPSITSDPTRVLKHSYLAGVRTQSMSQANEPEIAHVLELVKDHVGNRPHESLGVIAFGARHAVRLQDAFNLLEKQDSAFYNWKAEWNTKREKFFVKNIERVQGDERDAIIITPGYAPNLQGDVLLQFGSLNLAGGERRLNVAASRAKNSLHLVTSLMSSDINLTRTKSRSIALFRSFLEFMENHGRLEELSDGYAIPQSPFEEEVLEALTAAGLNVDCQVGDSRYKIDFGIRHPDTNEFILAVEADGWTYHSSPYARERDWLRQEVLERKGWTFVRIWSTDWWENPKQEVNRVIAAYEAALRKSSVPEYVQRPIAQASQERATESASEGNAEYDILKGLIAQFPLLPYDDALARWMGILGLQRRTAKTLQRFADYWARARKELK